MCVFFNLELLINGSLFGKIWSYIIYETFDILCRYSINLFLQSLLGQWMSIQVSDSDVNYYGTGSPLHHQGHLTFHYISS